MPIPTPQLTAPRRAGLLAAVAVYPLSRLAGTLPRPALDRALVSGTTMAVAFQAAAATTAALHGSSGWVGTPSPRRQALRTAASAVAVTSVAAAVAIQTRANARKAALEYDRLPVPAAATGAVAELVTVAAGSGALVALADALGTALPEPLRPANPVIVTVNVILAGAALGVAARHPRLLAHLSLPPIEGVPDAAPRFQRGARLPIAVARSAGVAAVTVAALTVETHAAEALARALVGAEDPGQVAVAAGHGLIAAGFLIAGGAGFGFYSSRIAVQERILEAAYAAVPARRGVSGGSDSAYDFADLGREGRRFVAQAHTADELIGVLATAASDPVRVFIPLTEVTSSTAAAGVVVAEIERLGGFAKGTMVLAAPTGDGYVSYVQTETVEMLTAGDCATVVVPYANVPSALAMPRRGRAAEAYAVYARAIAARARELNPGARLFTFGESLGSIVALDAFGPDVATELAELGFSGGLYCGVPVYSRTDRELRPRHPETRANRGLQYATGRDQVVTAAPGHLNLTHPTDPVAVADPSTLVRHGIDYWGRPHGVHIPLVSFLVHLFDVKNAMNLRPGQFSPSPGHDYRFETAAAVASAYGLSFHQEEVIEAALRERELAWSVRRLLSRRVGDARDSAIAKLQSWGVDPATLSTRFGIPERALPSWLGVSPAADATDEELPQPAMP